MNNKILTIIIGLALLVVIIPTIVSATLTPAQVSAIIGLLQSFGTDTATIANVQISLNGGTPNLQTAWCYTFNNNLGYVDSGINDVVNLHTALQKEGISYIPDDASTYFTGTSEGVAKFQTKYGISPNSGYVGLKTRAKLNQLYGCVLAICKPKWDCVDWGICLTGQQNRTCIDSNNCGVITNKPATSQSCIQKPDIKIQANNSDGPINIFLTLGDGATVSSSGITDVSSCMASDSLTPTTFSGYKPFSGSQTVTLSGTIQNAFSSNNKVSGTFKITCIPTKSGGNVNDSVTINLFYTVNGNCNPNWQCSSFGNCASSKHTRICTDYNGCGSLVGKPNELESCVVLPTVNIKANNFEGPMTIANGSYTTLSWISSGATSCIASGGWSGGKVVNATELVTTMTSSKTFTITCTNAGGSVSDSVVVNV
ncbi:MAG: hypothetical protein NT094_04895, partial [Candidatus Staskawiczbacteria bacterium]|nr:hypothetical protein [Candidatus Staskawiczbacteria bacterium]